MRIAAAVPFFNWPELIGSTERRPFKNTLTWPPLPGANVAPCAASHFLNCFGLTRRRLQHICCADSTLVLPRRDAASRWTSCASLDPPRHACDRPVEYSAMVREKKTSILFVCMGNICRSPMVETVARIELRACGHRGRDRVGRDRELSHRRRRRSARDRDRRSARVSARAASRAAGSRGRFRRLRSRSGDGSRQHAGALRRHRPRDDAREAALFLAHVGFDGLDEVPDPYYGWRRDFEHVLDLARRGSALLVERSGRLARAGTRMTARAPAKEFPADIEWVNSTRAPQLSEIARPRDPALVLDLRLRQLLERRSGPAFSRRQVSRWPDRRRRALPEISAAGRGRGRAARGKPASAASCGRERSRASGCGRNTASTSWPSDRADRCGRPPRSACSPARVAAPKSTPRSRGCSKRRRSAIFASTSRRRRRCGPSRACRSRFPANCSRTRRTSMSRIQRTSSRSRMHARGPRAASVRLGQSGILGRICRARHVSTIRRALARWRDALFVADRGNHAVRRISLANGRIDTLIGRGRPGRMRPHETPVHGSRAAFAERSRACSATSSTSRCRGCIRSGESISSPSRCRCSPAAAQLGLVDGVGGGATFRSAERARGARTPSGRRRCGGFVRSAGCMSMKHVSRRRSAPVSTSSATASASRAEARLQNPLGIAADPRGIVFIADSYNNGSRC